MFKVIITYIYMIIYYDAMRLELNTRSHKFPWGVSRMGLIIAGIPEFTRLCGLPGLWAILMQFWTGFLHPRHLGWGLGMAMNETPGWKL